MTGTFLARRARVALLALALVFVARAATAAVFVEGVRGEAAQVLLDEPLPAMRGDHLRATLVEVRYAPGAASLPHVHHCPVIGRVLSGALRTRVAGDSEHVYRAGESFAEPAGAAHLLSANASDRDSVTFLAYFVCDSDAPRSVALTAEIAR